MPSLIVMVALGIGGAILAEAMVSFLGFGDPKAVSWGQLLYFNYEALKVAPWASLAPGAAIFLTVLGFNLLADGLVRRVQPARCGDEPALLRSGTCGCISFTRERRRARGGRGRFTQVGPAARRWASSAKAAAARP